VYHRALHSINLYVWPAIDNGGSPVRERTIQGYNVLAWKKNAFEFRAVSDLKPKYLAISCALLRRKVWQTIHSFLGLAVFALRQRPRQTCRPTPTLESPPDARYGPV